MVGGMYFWENRAAAERVFRGEWRERVLALYNSDPTISWFANPVTVDNADRLVGAGCVATPSSPRRVDQKTRELESARYRAHDQQGPELLLIGAAAVVGVLRAVVPDHWVPIALIAPAGPIPTALSFFATDLCSFGLLGRCRKRKTKAVVPPQGQRSMPAKGRIHDCT